MGQIGTEGFGGIHPHNRLAPDPLLCVASEKGVRTLGEHILEGVGISDEARNEILEGEFINGVVSGESFDVTEAERLGLHIDDRVGELITPGDDSRVDYMGIGNDLYL